MMAKRVLRLIGAVAIVLVGFASGSSSDVVDGHLPAATLYQIDTDNITKYGDDIVLFWSCGP